MSLVLAVAMPKMSFGDWLHWRRRTLDISQGSLAEALGVTRQTVSQWERGKAMPALGIDKVQAFCKLLDVDLDTASKAFKGEIDTSDGL